jgi:hypothetical protein
MKIGPGWIPNFLEVKSSDGGKYLTAVLIELEATPTVAMESARKYIPEDPSLIIDAIKASLCTILGQCRVTADPRVKELEKLLGLVSAAQKMEILTAAGLRDTTDLVEMLPLLHQPAISAPQPKVTSFGTSQRFEAKGQRLLSREEANGLSRAVRILDAVTRGRDESGANYHSWLNLREKPLHKDVAQSLSPTAELRRLLHKPRSRGLRVDFDRLIDELYTIWSRSPHPPHSKPQITTSIELYFPIAQSIRAHTPMPEVFHEARQILAKSAQ